MDEDIEQLAEQHGGYWGNHLDYPSEDWRLDVANGDTRRGYWEWVEARLQDAKDEAEEADDELSNL
jgi:hypothetical protein